MSNAVLECFLHYKPKQGESLAARHETVVTAMQKISNPLSWRNQVAPTLPDFGEELIASYELRYPGIGIRLLGIYKYRGAKMLFSGDATDDDKMIFAVNTSKGAINYSQLLCEYLPEAVIAYNAYLLRGFYEDHALRFHDLHREEIRKLGEEIDLNGRNNVFSLQPVQFWSEEVCRKAMKFGPDEVIRRLAGKVPHVKPLMDGVYVVFSDNPDLSFEEFCAYNDALKPVLGLA